MQQDIEDRATRQPGRTIDAASTAKPGAPSLPAWIAAAGAAAVAALIPALKLPVGSTTIIVLPITYTFLLAAILNLIFRRHIGHVAADQVARRFGAALPVAMLPFVVMLGALVGQNWRVIVDAGPALVLQEVGHFGGTVLLSFPVAVWVLRLGRETVGATFSIAREPSVAIIAERYGLRSPEGTGVLAVYIIGTLGGTLLFSILASLAAGTGWFDHRALAVACGIGSGSMTAACAGALGLAYAPYQSEIFALAAASNLLSAIGGFYVTLFVSLPLVDYLYKRSGWGRGLAEGARNSISARDGDGETATRHDWLALVVASILVPAFASKSVWSAILLSGTGLALSGLAILIARHAKPRLPAIAWASFLGLALGLIPVARPIVVSTIGNVDPLALVMLPLAIAGFAIGADEARAARKVGWKLLIVSMTVFVGTFAGAALIAQMTLSLH